MIEELPIHEPGICIFKAIGTLSDIDYQQFIPRLENLIDEYGKISVLLELEEFHGWEPKAAWDDFKLGHAHPDDFERIAVVGDKAWEHWITILAKPFTHAQVRYFANSERDKAWDWLRQNVLSAITQLATSSTPYRKILIATDFSTASAKAIKRGLEIAARDNAEVMLVHVVVDEYENIVKPHASDEISRKIDLAHARLKKILEVAGSPQADFLVRAGLPEVEIFRYARQHDADLIVIGANDSDCLNALLAPPEEHLLATSCDVLVASVED